MKYKNLNQIIPQDKRKEINEKILYSIDNDLCCKFNLTKEIIFNMYTGDGGLSGVELKDYDSFYSYTKTKQEFEQGQFYTPFQTMKYLMEILKIDETKTILDLTCGIGNVFNFAKNEFNCYGCEVDRKSYKIAKYLYPNANITCGDMREYNPGISFDFVVGNPPFNLDLLYKGERKKSQIVFVEKSYQLLNAGGILAIIVPKSFLNDEFSEKGTIAYMNSNFSFIGQIELNNDTFKYLGVNNFETKIILFKKRSQHLQNNDYKNEFIKVSAEDIYLKYMKPVYDELEENKNKIYLENKIEISKEKDNDFEFKIKKLLFDIKRTKATKDKYNWCINYYNKLLNQKQPTKMKWEEWVKIRITKEDVINKFKNILSKQHNRKVIKSENKQKVEARKMRECKNQSILFQDMKIDKSIDKWLSEKSLFDNFGEKEIKLTDKQRYDMNKIIQKRYGYLQWDMGGGKSLSSLFYGLYRLENNNCKNIFVVAPAIAIKNTYVEMLENFKIKYRVINTREDIKSIKSGEFVLLTFGMLIKNERFIKKFIKMNNRKFTLILDEADNISNPDSKRTKSTLNCFRRLKYKLLLSGTSTRNSLNELFTQFELLYNNSLNMLCENEYLYVVDKDTKELKEVYNEYQNKPFPPYKKGFKLFTSSHIPGKTTVFGVAKFTQDIYNKEYLKKLINKTMITRTLKDITGRELYNINQVTCEFTKSEFELYKKILDKFYEMSSEYHIHTGNSRKDSLFKILAQLNTLLKACSVPHSFKEYLGTELSSKVLKVCEMVNNFKNESIAIGCTRVKTVKIYKYELRRMFPNRKVFTIIGNENSLKQRKNIIKEFEKSKNGILLSTQQSLSCSMNIGFVNKVIIPEMNWTESSIGQYRARFARMNSKDKTEVYNVFYNGSIENNLLKLLMAKEKLCRFAKDEELTDSELYEKYGIDDYLFKKLMIKEKNEDGLVCITWGEQNIN